MTSINAHATGFYVGVDAMRNDVANKLQDVPNTGLATDSNKDSNLSYGANAGFRLDLLGLLASGEVFYDRLNLASEGFDGVGKDRVKIGQRYGARANIGYTILPKIKPFISYGLANISYKTNADFTINKSTMTPIYGIGIIVDLVANFSLKAAYDFQRFKTKYPNSIVEMKSNVGTARLGVMYQF